MSHETARGRFASFAIAVFVDAVLLVAWAQFRATDFARFSTLGAIILLSVAPFSIALAPGLVAGFRARRAAEPGWGAAAWTGIAAMVTAEAVALVVLRPSAGDWGGTSMALLSLVGMPLFAVITAVGARVGWAYGRRPKS